MKYLKIFIDSDEPVTLVTWHKNSLALFWDIVIVPDKTTELSGAVIVIVSSASAVFLIWSLKELPTAQLGIAAAN